MKRFYNTANGEYITLSELQKLWDSFDESEKFPHDNFNDFLTACMIENKGMLMEV